MLKRLLFLLLLLPVSCAPQNNSSFRVSEVIDGDTIKLSNGKLLRYIGLDTPEIRRKDGKKFIYEPQLFSLEAKEYNRALVEGKQVRVEFDIDKKDRYNRLLGYCFVDKVFVNAKLIEAGYAVLYTYPPNIKYLETFVLAQKKARKNKKGLWGAYPVIAPNEADRFIGQIRTIRGMVLSAYNSGKTIYLNFGHNYKTDFTVVIFQNSFKYFHNKGIQPESFYKGKTVEVSGKIRQYNGPEIIINTPEEITIW